MPYIQELRALVGHRPLILMGTMVMIFDGQHRVLLQHRSDDAGSSGSSGSGRSATWDFPGGFMEPGESTEAAARREVLEETGLEIGQMTLFQVLSGEAFFYTCPNGDQVFSVSTVYVTGDVRGDPRADGVEGSEVRFFPLDDLPSGLIPNDRMVLESFIASGGFERYLPGERNKNLSK